MAESILGLDFDIHGGGSDLLFPHHENEIAQTEAGRARPLARLWMHNGMVRFGEEKMAKSVGNIRLLSDALDEFGRDALIMYFLSGHYRQPLSFSAGSLEQALRSLERMTNLARLLERVGDDKLAGAPRPEVAGLRGRFFASLRDDFNTPQALASLFELVSEGNRRLEAGEGFAGGKEALAEMLQVLALEGLLGAGDAPDEDALELARQREQARSEQDFERADLLRRRLAERGYSVRDTPEGPLLVRSPKTKAQ